MKKIIIGIVALSCVAAFVPAAFAGDTEDCRPWFTPTLRVGLAVDAQRPLYSFQTNGTPLLGISRIDLELRSVERPYLALELPFAVTDRLTLTLDGDWSFTGWERDINERYNFGTAGRTWDSDGTAHWVSSDLLLSYALIKDRPIIKDLSVVAGVRWDYQTMSFGDPEHLVGVNSSPVDTVDFRMQTLAPVGGLSLTVGGLKSGIWLGDVHLAVLAGPIVWGNEDYRETFGSTAFTLKYQGDISHGYVVRGYGDITLLSGKITPTMEALLAFFAQLTKTSVHGDVDGRIFAGSVLAGRGPQEFRGDNFTLVFGLSASLAFDICEPVAAPAPAPAPVIEPKLEPMSYK
jgi:hypothetical protein